jgi:hypothetical protein
MGAAAGSPLDAPADVEPAGVSDGELIERGLGLARGCDPGAELALLHGGRAVRAAGRECVLRVEVIADEQGQVTTVVMDQSPPSYGATVRHAAPVAAALGLTPDRKFCTAAPPAQVVGTGAAHPLSDRRS